MERFFSTEGPVRSDLHYLIPPLERVDIEEVLGLVERQKYFVLHAPRQTGKTSTLLALADHLNSSGAYRCVYMNVEAAQVTREDVAEAIAVLLSEMASRATEMLLDESVIEIWRSVPDRTGPGALL